MQSESPRERWEWLVLAEPAADSHHRPLLPAPAPFLEWQANALTVNVDVNDLASMYNMAVDSVPPISFNRTLDWQYGDVREVIYSVSWLGAGVGAAGCGHALLASSSLKL
jgi:hypothetical protein